MVKICRASCCSPHGVSLCKIKEHSCDLLLHSCSIALFNDLCEFLGPSTVACVQAFVPSLQLFLVIPITQLVPPRCCGEQPSLTTLCICPTTGALSLFPWNSSAYSLSTAPARAAAKLLCFLCNKSWQLISSQSPVRNYIEAVQQMTMPLLGRRL